MIFVDTNIWMEAFALSNPKKDKDKDKAKRATNFLKNNTDEIVTCKEQIIELVNAIQKAKREEFSDKHKELTGKGIGYIKDFRRFEEFNDVIAVCKNVYTDILHMACLDNDFTYDINEIIASLRSADINDIMYFNYCLNKGIKFYTMDKELVSMDNGRNIAHFV